MRQGLAIACLAVTAVVSGAAADAASRPAIRTDHRCYLVGQPVHMTGSGFAPTREFDVAVDGIDFGQSTTNDLGGFSVRAGLGSLRGVAQHVEQLSASDGTSQAGTTVTLTARAGARFLATHGNSGSLRAPVEVWGFSPDGPAVPVFLHYVSPAKRLRTTVRLGRTGGQCGYLHTASVRVFPFTPSRGAWQLQIDTQAGYAARPVGPVARFTVRVS